MRRMIGLSALAVMMVTTVTLGAQEALPPKPTPVKIQLVLSRYQGDKKLSSVPYTLSVTANDPRGSASVRMGVQVPIPSGTGTFNYRDVGTNIDCSATTPAEGQFKVSLTVADSSVYFQDQETAAGSVPRPSGMPAFRSFTSTFSVWLRDGQTSQYTSVTDQVSGQVLKIDATLTVLK